MCYVFYTMYYILHTIYPILCTMYYRARGLRRVPSLSMLRRMTRSPLHGVLPPSANALEDAYVAAELENTTCDMPYTLHSILHTIDYTPHTVCNMLHTTVRLLVKKSYDKKSDSRGPGFLRRLSVGTPIS